MAQQKISALPAASALGGADAFEVVQGGVSKKATATQIKAFASAWQILASKGAAVSHTGSTAETDLLNVVLPAGALGPNGQVRITTLVSAGANNANAKTIRYRFGGGAIQSFSLASTLIAEVQRRIANRNSQSSQVSYTANIGSFVQAGAPVATAAIDTSAAVIIRITGALADAADTITLESVLIEYCYGA